MQIIYEKQHTYFIYFCYIRIFILHTRNMKIQDYRLMVQCKIYGS